jgi:nucleotide-binding universal stress UspA family protein
MVPLDGFRFAEQALPQAIEIAREAGARVHITHALDMLMRPPYADRVTVQEWWNGAAIRLAEEYVAEQANQIRAHGLEVTQSVLNGGPRGSVAAEADRVEPDLIVMTTHGRGPLSRMWIGSVADEVVRESGRPVLLIRASEKSRPRAPVRFQHVLVPLDGSPVSEQILNPALDLARLLGARVTLLHVAFPSSVVLPPIGMDSLTTFSTPDADGLLPEETAGHDYLSFVRASLVPNGTPIDTSVLLSSASVFGEISQYAKTHAVDLIAIATPGHHLLYNLLGGVTDQTVRSARQPILVLTPRPEHARKQAQRGKTRRRQRAGSRAVESGR